MRPPSSCPTGKRLSAVTKSPTQPASATGCTKTSMPSGMRPKAEIGHEPHEERVTEGDDIALGNRAHPRPREAQPQRGQRHQQPGERARGGDVEEGLPVPRGRAHPDHRAQGAEQEERRRRGDEVRQAHRRAVGPRGEVVAELVRAQDGEEGEGERQPIEQAARLGGGIEGDPRERARHHGACGQGREHGEQEERQGERAAAAGSVVSPSGSAWSHTWPRSRLKNGVKPRTWSRGSRISRARAGSTRSSPPKRKARPRAALLGDGEDVLQVAPQEILERQHLLGGRRGRRTARGASEGPEAHSSSRYHRANAAITRPAPGRPASR